MKVTVRISGIMRSLCKWDEQEFELGDGASLSELKQRIESEHREIDFDQLRPSISINQKLVDDSATLNDGDSISFLPPLAGG